MQTALRHRRWLAAGAGILLCAATAKPATPLPIQIADTGPLAAAVAAPAAKPPAPAVKATDAIFEAAPVPDENLDAPGQAHGAGAPQLSPALLSAKAAFAGNGFGDGSSQEQATNDRQHPAAGLSLSVPVK